MLVLFYMCRLPWPDHSKSLSETFTIYSKFTEGKDFANYISSDTKRHNYATFQESTIVDISILNFKIRIIG